MTLNADSATKQRDAFSIYFGYGSNLWLDQMSQRCPNSSYLGIARLPSYSWIINSRGYANVVQLSNNTSTSQDASQGVWGLVYRLTPEDEARLDMNEGVPTGYTKEYLAVEFWPTTKSTDQAADSDLKKDNSDDNQAVRLQEPPQQCRMLVYIDRHRTDGKYAPKDEYVVRMNNGIADALKVGVPATYFDRVLRKWIPEQSPESAREKATRQALKFEDEN